MSELRLVQSEVCPYAQRTHMCLLEKSVDFEVVEVDLGNKPAWFEEISPYSKVPVLQHGDVRLYESSIINEYLEDAFPEPALLPKSPADRARARIWIDFDNVKFVPAFYRVLLEQESSRQQALVDEIIGHLEFFESEGLPGDWEGPFWFGKEVSLVDLALYPHFERLVVLETYRNIAIPPACARLGEWYAAMKERDSARQTAHDDAYHLKAYSKYADGTASGTTAKDMRSCCGTAPGKTTKDARQ
ncbi:MAG: glutathione S-transferase family protein [Gammaproteobacteria bacterium]|nr:glutathione S-transferase family protein [Gammaproteobacteria bacterium]